MLVSKAHWITYGDELKGNGLVVAAQQHGAFRFNTGDQTRGHELPNDFRLPVRHVDIGTAINFCTLLGMDNFWYWEDATRSWGSGGVVQHYQGDDHVMRRLVAVVYVVVPNAPTSSPVPGALIGGDNNRTDR